METPTRPNELMYTPAVFAVKNYYQIMTIARSEILFWVEVGGKKFYDHSNGIIRSISKIKRVNVPMELLDNAGEYTVCYKRIIERKAYFPTTEDEVTQTFKFRGIPKEGPIKMHMLSDTHGRFTAHAQSSKFFGDDLDLFILNGDINESKSIDAFDLVFQLCEAVTGGSRPCLYVRGNHDTRGEFSELLAEYSPTENGHSYFSVKLGRLWAMVLDCGEDKWDWHPEYGGTVSCTQFREEQSLYFEEVVKNANNEYNAEGVQYRLALCHVPFCRAARSEEFDPDPEIYIDWCKKLKEDVKAQVMLCGHFHNTKIYEVGGEIDSKGQPCTVVVGLTTALTLDGNKLKVEFVNAQHEVLETHIIDLIK